MRFNCVVVLCLSIVRISHSDLYQALEVHPGSSDSEIKKSYRRLALELHPDKIPANVSEPEKERMTQQFIEVQNAYEVLGDPESRLRYDLSTQGIEYSVREAKEKQRYTSKPFAMFTRTKNVKLLFQAHFKKKSIPEIAINVPISARDVFTSVNGNVSFYRSVKCKSCGGNGGMNGSCTTCHFCSGNGVANHLFRDNSRTFQQMTKTECGICGGRGCLHEHGNCAVCKGSGFVMELTSIAYSLPLGFPDGFEISFAGIGHEDLDGDVGSIKLRFMISFPPLWSVESPQSINLIYALSVSFTEMAKGLRRVIMGLNGAEIKVKHEKLNLITAITSGASSLVFPDQGLIGPDGSRGCLMVKIAITFDDLSEDDILSALKIGEAYGGKNGLLGKLFDLLNPASCEDDNDNQDCKSRSGEQHSSQEKKTFTTSSDDVSFI